MTKAYIGLGANLGDPARQVQAALTSLKAATGLRLCGQSSLYRSAPLGLPGQSDYCNAVCEVETTLAPQALFEVLLGIERAAGRVRDGQRWGPRVLDLDLLHYQDVVQDTPQLRLPHPEIAKRNFVLIPLAEIAPQLEIPGLGRASDLALAIGQQDLVLWAD